MKEIEKVRKKIKNRYVFHEAVKQILRNEKDDEEKVNLIQYLAQHSANCNMGKYSDEELEFELVRIGQKIPYKPSCEPEKGTVLHIMTMAYAIGGHTAVVNNWIAFDHQRKYSVLITDEHKNFLPPFLLETVEENGGEFHQLKSCTIWSKVNELLKIAQRYEKVILHTHTFDAVPILAFSNPNWKIPIYFFNQANFRFSLGMSITDCFIGMYNYDSIKGKRYRGAEKVVTLPIPTKITENNLKQEFSEKQRIQLKRKYAKKYNFPEDAQIILSMGASFKFKKVINYDFPEFLQCVLKRTSSNVYAFVIGAKNRGDKRWKRLKKRSRGRGQALPTLSRKEISEWMAFSDVFITSFPMNSSGKDEALENGMACFSLQITKRGMEAEDHNHCKDIQELTDRICGVLDRGERYFTETSPFKEMMKTPKAWSAYVNQILDMDLEHKIHKFKSKLLVSKEEIINFQLLEREERLETYPAWERLSLDNQIKISLLAAITKNRILRNRDKG